MEGDLIVVIVVATALAFDFTNGFHDTANVVATSISTRAMAPRIAVGYAAILNFAGAFLSLAVAATIANDVVNPAAVSLLAVFGGLVGAITWNLITWYFGLPSSSSHALIGGMVGAVLVAEGPSAISFDEGILGKVMIPAIVAPILAFIVAGASILVLYRIVGRLRLRPVTRGFRGGQVLSGGMLALAHGTNDAQKTMGVITLALVANGTISQSDFHVPNWVVVSSASAIALGHLRGRLADHQDDGQPYSQDGFGPGLRGTGRRCRRDPRGLQGRLPALHDPHHLGSRDRVRRRQAAVGGALGRGRQHHRRVGHDASRGGVLRRAHLQRHQDLRDGRGRPDHRLRGGPRRHRPAAAAQSPAARHRVGGRRGGGHRMIASIVDTDALLEVIWVSIAAGIGLTAVYGVVIVGASRALDSGRQGHTVGAVLYGAMGVLALAVVVVAIVLGIESLSDK